MQHATRFKSLGDYSFMDLASSQQRQFRPEAHARDTYAGVVLCRSFRLFHTCGGVFGLICSISSRLNYLMGAISWLEFSFVSGNYLGYNVGQKSRGTEYFLQHTNLVEKGCTQYPLSSWPMQLTS